MASFMSEKQLNQLITGMLTLNVLNCSAELILLEINPETPLVISYLMNNFVFK